MQHPHRPVASEDGADGLAVSDVGPLERTPAYEALVPIDEIVEDDWQETSLG